MSELSPPPSPHQPSAAARQYSREQQDVIEAPLDGVLLVRAYAGTGKTTTLVGVSERHARRRGLYLAFNKSAQLDAQARFPRNITCKTVHALAYGAVGHKYRAKLTDKLREPQVIAWLGLTYDYAFARMVIDTIGGWCVGDDERFPTVALTSTGAPLVENPRAVYAARMAQNLWTRMCDVHDEAGMTHDGYLKLYQLSRPQIGVDFLMLDEAQDTNPVTWDIVTRQSCPLLLVGDGYQSIFKFRGAVNSLDRVRATQVRYLTESYRFGSRVAEIASVLLEQFFDERRPLIGLGPDTSLGAIDGEDTGSRAILCRTNAGVFDEAASAVTKNRSLFFIGGISSYQFGKVLDVYRLYSGEAHLIRDSYIRSFASYAELFKCGNEADDPEIRALCSLVDTYGQRIPSLIDSIQGATINDMSSADRTLSTAHKSKGSNLRRVVMSHDFPDLCSKDGPLPLKGSAQASEAKQALDREEVHLAYVAATRAIEHLQINAPLTELLDYATYDL